jgi:radical SAM superfamily enzyme YgiQ (UPF0313 family)
MPCPVFPLGLAYLAKALRKDGHTIEVLDLCFSQDVFTDLKNTIHHFQPELIGISLRNLDNLTFPAPISYLKELEEVVGICRQASSSRLVIGGSGYSLTPKELLQSLDIDFGIVGEGEEVLVQLVKYLEKGEIPSPTQNLLIKGKPFPQSIEGAQVFPFQSPDRSLFQIRRYFEEGGMGNIQTKRGCPFSCIYCTYPLLEGKKLRLREVDEVVQEIRLLVQEHGVDYL